MLNTNKRLLTQKFLAIATLGIGFAAGLVVVSAINAMHGMAPLYKQKRYGQNGQEFNVWKFQSMRPGPEADSKRITRFGAFLRKTSLDELPQVLNVMKGEMDLVGWRPLKRTYLDIWNDHKKLFVNPDDAKFQSVEDAIALIAQTKPGIFGTIQVSEYRGTYESGDIENFVAIVKKEAAYVQQRELGSTLEAIRQDYNILAAVPSALFKHKGHVVRDNDDMPTPLGVSL